MQKAIIYCRVSSDRQVKEGHGLESQERLCREYAKRCNYEVVKVFHDEGSSGGLFDRPAMKRLLAYLDNYSFLGDEKIIVIFDDLKRFARDVQVHFNLKREIYGRRGTVESPNFKFEDTPEGKFVETVLAGAAELERNQNKRQVIQKQKARLESGYWTFCHPPALKFINSPLHGKILTPNEPYATIFKEAIEDYRDGRLNTLEDVQFLINDRYYKYKISKEISINGAYRVLINPLYAGYIEYKPWNVQLRKAKHEGFISFETYQVVQEKLKLKSKPPLRKDYNLDFPLRGYILCSECKKPYTGSWHPNRNKTRYAHYFCKQKDCIARDKTVRKELLESQFEELIQKYTPNKDVLNLSKVILSDIWMNKDKVEEEGKKIIQSQISDLEAKKRQFMDRVANSTNADLIAEYEKELEKIIQKKKELEANLPKKIYSQDNFGTAMDIVFKYLENPVRMFQSDNYKDKRLLLEMYFEEKLAYKRFEGFGTPSLAPLVKLLCLKESPKNDLVEVPRVELGSGRAILKMFR